MSHTTTSVRRTLATLAVVAFALTAAACGAQTAGDVEPDQAPPRSSPSVAPQAQSDRALDADARRAAHGYPVTVHVKLRRTAPHHRH